uniref:RRM domain-containing protein n=1 Tax=Trichuris muris TaxID=70415 RepID=A0A5S6QWB8_TRIMR
MNKRHANSEPEEELNRRTVFVSNLPPDVKQRDLLKLMRQIGAVETVRLRSCIPKDPKMPKKVAAIKGELIGRVNAYVCFKEEGSVEKALNLGGSEFRGHHIFVDSCLSKRKYEKKRSVFVGNLPFEVTEDQLYDHFVDCGEVTAVRVVRDKKYGLGKGFGYVVFRNASSTLLAMKLHGSQLGSRQIRVFRIESKDAGSNQGTSNNANVNSRPAVGKQGKVAKKGKKHSKTSARRKAKVRSIMK